MVPKKSRVINPAEANGSPQTDPNPGSRRWLRVLLGRWPTYLAILFALTVAYGLEEGGSLYFGLFIMQLCYLAAAALDRRGAAWVVLLVSIPAVIVTMVLNLEPTVGLLLATVIFLGLGVTRWRNQGSWGMPLQTAGMFAFGGLSVAVLFVNPALGSYLVAAGLIGHGLWDVVHHRANKVAARSFAEWCAVYDFVLGAVILALPVLSTSR